jgi:hypothetical protein
MDCYEDQVRDKIEISPVVAKSFWNESKRLRDAGKDWNGIVTDLSERSGLQEATVARVLSSDKRLKAITNDMWLKRAKYAEIQKAARDMVNQADTPAFSKAAGQVWDATRRSLTIGHGGIFPFSHMRNMLFASRPEAKIFAQAVKDAYSYATPNTGKARWARDMDALVRMPGYDEAIRYGVEAKPESEPVGILASGAKGWGKRGYDSLKPARIKLWNAWKDQLPADMRMDEVTARELARRVNYATGALSKGMLGEFSAVASKGLFAPKLWFAKRLEAFQPLSYLIKGGRMTEGQRAVSNLALKRWAKIVAVNASILAANDAYNKYFGDDKNRVNWTDLTKPGTLWRMNVNGFIVPMSPLVEVIRTPVAAVASLFMDRKQLHGDAPLQRAWDVASKDLLNALHPSITSAAELISGREIFGKPGHLRRLPFPGAKQLVKGEEPEKDKAMPLPEYLMEKGPIPAGAFARPFYQALQDEGASPTDAKLWVKSLVYSVLSGAAGTHIHEQSNDTNSVSRSHSYRPKR